MLSMGICDILSQVHNGLTGRIQLCDRQELDPKAALHTTCLTAAGGCSHLKKNEHVLILVHYLKTRSCTSATAAGSWYNT